jgi:hypothetical protein
VLHQNTHPGSTVQLNPKVKGYNDNALVLGEFCIGSNVLEGEPG